MESLKSKVTDLQQKIKLLEVERDELVTAQNDTCENQLAQILALEKVRVGMEHQLHHAF